jgi:hypothetical protein
MANIRVSAAVTTVLSAATSAAVASIAASVPYISVAPVPVNPIRVTAFVVPMEFLEEQTVSMSDFRAFDIRQVSIDISLATDDVAISFGKALTDEVTALDTPNRIINSSVDFDPSDDDVDPDPISMADADAKDLGKTLTDASATTDADVKSVGKVLTDAATATEEINTKDVGKALSDAATAADEVNTFAVDRVSTDSVTASEADAKSFERGNTDDTVTASDDSTRFIQPAYSDGVTSQEVINTFTIGKTLTDTTTLSEAQVFAIETVLSDTVLMTDLLAKSVGENVDFDRTDADIDPDPVTASDVRVVSIETVYTDTTSGSDVAVYAVTKVITDSVTMAESVVTELILGESTAFYPDYVSMDDGNNFVFHRYRTSVPDYSEVLGGSDSLFNSTYMQNASDDLTYENYTGIIGGPGLMLTAPLINGEFITYGYSTGAGLVVNFHYTDAADRTVGGYQFNQTPIL